MNPEQIKQLQTQLNLRGANLKVDGILGPKTTAAMNNAVTGAIASNPTLAPLVAQNNPETILNAYQSGNWSGIVDVTGKPFSDEDQRLAVEKSGVALNPAFEAEKTFNEENLIKTLEDSNRNFNQYLDTTASDFESDKENLDLDAANKGVLFSGSRIQKEKNLKNVYEKDLEAKRAKLGSDISGLAGDFQYKYGDESINKPTISQYYKVGENSYNPNVAKGGAVRSSGLSSIYNAGKKGYQGTEVNKNKSAIQTRAASLLTNKANKIVPYGYKNQF